MSTQPQPHYHFFENQRALQAVLVPLARLCLKFGISYRAFDDLARSAFVDAAKEPRSGRGHLNQSRVALLTGLSRREVRRYFTGEAKVRSRVSVPAMVLGDWANHRRWSDARGRPARLRFTSTQGRSFTSLCQVHTTNCNANTIAAELIDAGCIERDGDHVHLINPIYQPAGDTTRLLEVGLHAVQRLLETVQHNIASAGTDAALRYEQVYVSRFIPRARLPELRSRLKELLGLSKTRMADTIDRAETPGPLEKDTVGVGLFYFEDPEDL